MIKLEHINISFNDKKVFEDASFSACENKITVVAGESGSGKSTLINTLLFKFGSNYYYNGNLVDLLEKDNFIFQYIGYVPQVPCFIERLTIDQHISLVLDTYHLTSYDSSLLEKLSISDLLPCFPNQLSMGEKARVSLFLALMKNPKILILDEPTAYIDDLNKKIVLDLMRKQANQGSIVIVASHDKIVIESSDVKYTIKDKKFLTQSIVTHSNDKMMSFFEKKTDYFEKYAIYINKNHKLSFKLLSYSLSLLLAFSLFSFSFNNAALSQLNQQIHGSFSNEIIVYKNVHETRRYSFDGQEEGIDDKYIQKIKSLDNIKIVKKRFDILMSEKVSSTSAHIINGDINIDEVNKVVGHCLEKDSWLSLSDYSLQLHLYYEEIDYSNNILIQYNDRGVYISSELFKRMFESEEVECPEIEFYIPIPVYNTDGTTFVPTKDILSESPSDYIPVNSITSYYKKVRMPIRGVVDGSVLGEIEDGWAYQIYINEKDFDLYMNSIKDMYSPTQTIYYVNEVDGSLGRYINSIPETVENNQIEQVIDQVKWSPNGISVFVEDITTLDATVNAIESLGYECESRYINTQALLDINTVTTKFLVKVSLGVLVIFLIFYIFIQYSQRNTDKDCADYLYNLGFNNKEINLFIYQKWLTSSRKMFMNSFVLFILLIIISELLNITYINLNIMMIIYLFIMSIMIEFVIPFGIRKLSTHD